MDSIERWKVAQESEENYWLLDAEKKFLQDDRKMIYYRDRAHELDAWLTDSGVIEKPVNRILEIGCGPLGVCGFMDAGEKHALDPLEHFYGTRKAFTRFRNPDVKYVDGKAEELPYSDGYFDLVIIDNAIDHAITPRLILTEVSRVLNDKGHLYISLHVYTEFAHAARTFIEKTVQIDKGHPHLFKASKMNGFIEECGFKVVKDDCETTEEVRKRTIRNAYLRRRVYGFLGLAGMDYRAVCRKS